jgi:hypothetical protein
LRSFVAGLGGKDISPSEFDHILQRLQHSPADADAVEPELMMTESEWRQVRQRLATAGKSAEAVEGVKEAVP